MIRLWIWRYFMRLLVIGSKARIKMYTPAMSIVDNTDIVVVERGANDETIASAAPDAEAILVDAISPVSENLIRKLPRLKMIHSEGVAFNAIDIEAASRQGIFVCNCQGANAVAVAEQTLLLILGLQKHIRAGDRAVRQGRQIKMKEDLMLDGIDELCGSKVGLVGFGSIAQQVARLLTAFDAEVFYNKRSPLVRADEERLCVHYLSLDDLLASCDYVSIHTPVTPMTNGMVNTSFLKKMKPTACLINTARGEIVNNEHCRQALIDGTIAGAAFDTLYPEPVTADNPLVDLPDNIQDRVLFSPHIGGVTTNMFRRGYRMVWENIERVSQGEEPVRVVNRGLMQSSLM
jgi:phosphoglycerate dehydrogenase-like enzyme